MQKFECNYLGSNSEAQAFLSRHSDAGTQVSHFNCNVCTLSSPVTYSTVYGDTLCVLLSWFSCRLSCACVACRTVAHLNKW